MVGSAILLMAVSAAAAPDAWAVSSVRLCVPKKVGSALLTPKHGKCKKGYTLTTILGAIGNIVRESPPPAGTPPTITSFKAAEGEPTQYAGYTVPAGHTAEVVAFFGKYFQAGATSYAEISWRIENPSGEIVYQLNSGLVLKGPYNGVFSATVGPLGPGWAPSEDGELVSKAAGDWAMTIPEIWLPELYKVGVLVEGEAETVKLGFGGVNSVLVYLH